MPILYPNPLRRQHQRSQTLRLAVLAAFSQSAGSLDQTLGAFSEQEWSANLFWLDASGLALYLLDHLLRNRQERILPPLILQRLKQNLVDNTLRNLGMLHETLEISRSFQREGVLFACLKGVTLSPESVPDPALRLQLDLDFLVSSSHIETAARVLERQGYGLACISGNTWEFKAGQTELAQIEDLYKARSQRSAELHVAEDEDLLGRAQVRSFSGHPLPVLEPADLYIGQALHLFKHLRSAFTRSAWLLEHQRNMLAHSNDLDFWERVTIRVTDDPSTLQALHFVTVFLTNILGTVAPAALRVLIAGHEDPAVELWIKLYGSFVLLADFPGTKLYLLLEAKSARRKRLLPYAPPPSITQRTEDQSHLKCLIGRLVQLRYIAFRLRFHTVEGLRYSLESVRFHRFLARRIH